MQEGHLSKVCVEEQVYYSVCVSVELADFDILRTCNKLSD